MIFGIFLLLSIFLEEDPIKVSLKKVSSAEIRKTVLDLVSFHNRNTNGESKEGDKGIGAARRYLKKKLESFKEQSGGRLEVFEDWFEAEGKRIKTPLQVANVIAKLPGVSDPERIYIVNGHYDSINSDRFDTEGFAPGANDDASGTAVTVELARVLSQEFFPATILFVCYAGEEQGLLGSKHHAKSLKDSGTFVDGVIANDIVGSSLGENGIREPKTIRVFSQALEGNSASREWAKLARNAAAQYLPELNVQLIFRRDRIARGGDHLPFEEQGFPAIRFTEANESYRRQHQNVRIEGELQYGDLPEYVDFDYTARVAQLNLLTIVSAALAPRPPQNVVAKGAVSTVTKLSWDTLEDKNLESYEIVWRKTDEVHWSGSKNVGKSTSLTLDLVLDNYFFGVRSISNQGHRSRISLAKEL